MSRRDLLCVLLGCLLMATSFGVRGVLTEMATQDARLTRIEAFLTDLMTRSRQ